MLLIGFLISVYIAFAAERKSALTRSGALAAIAVGTTVFGLGGGVAGLSLMTFFLTGTALSRHRKAEKERRTGDVVEKGAQRDAMQVLANGGAAAAFCALYALTGRELFYVGAVGSLAAAAGDTWATEIGSLARGEPWHILTLRRVPAGTSGGVSVQGLWGMAAGALLIGLLTLWEPAPRGLSLLRALVVLVGGIAGALADSLLGATVQERRACLECGAATEQVVHRCGGGTRCTGGIEGLGNDAVNALATAIGGTAAALAWMLWGGD